MPSATHRCPAPEARGAATPSMAAPAEPLAGAKAAPAAAPVEAPGARHPSFAPRAQISVRFATSRRPARPVKCACRRGARTSRAASRSAEAPATKMATAAIQRTRATSRSCAAFVSSRAVTIRTTAWPGSHARTVRASTGGCHARTTPLARTATPVSSRRATSVSVGASLGRAGTISTAWFSACGVGTRMAMARRNACPRSCPTLPMPCRASSPSAPTPMRPCARPPPKARGHRAAVLAHAARRRSARQVSSAVTCGETDAPSASAVRVPV